MDQLVKGVIARDHRILSKAISLVENEEPGFRDVLVKLYPRTGHAYAIGVTGPTGTGKSTLVDKVIQEYRKRGKTVSVLAIDPSSIFSGGALLGDRIRMLEHSLDKSVFIRSMASRGSLGGLSRSARNIMRLLDASGFDIIIVETVGVGQLELEISKSVESTIVVLMPQSGDEVQTMKAGLMEIGDVFVVNKADLPNVHRTVYNVGLAVQARDGWKPPVLKTIARTGKGVEELVDALEKRRRFLVDSRLGPKMARRRIEQELLEIASSQIVAKTVLRLRKNANLEKLVERVAKRDLDPETAGVLLARKAGAS